ncbi:uncharacterized protein LOC113341718 [Papaver somniferum]|uniref:uncharacterized protein LOC113341718 n=1 Tax=Papaver somniferum TaxID=3469 RepID=UPI000E6FB49E|nr:uncharacterized protein LOC113341718 [Papaver somniferum]
MAADNLLPSNPSSISNKNRKSSTSVNNPEFIIGSNEFLLGVSGAKVIIPGTKNSSYISCLSNPSINSPSSSIKLVYEEPISEDDSSFAAFTSDPIPMINGTSKEVEEGTEVGGKTSIPLATGEATLVVSQLDVVDASKQWKTFFKRKKNVGRKEYLMQAPTCSSNSFEALSEEQERVRVEDRHIDTENREVGIEEEEFTNEDGNSSEEVPVEGEIVIQVNPNNILNSELPFPIFSGDENGMEVDALKDDNESVKTHGVESVLKDNPIRALESSTQNVNALIKFSALLGAPRGGSEKQRKDMFTELALEYQNRNPVVEKSRKAPKIEK